VSDAALAGVFSTSRSRPLPRHGVVVKRVLDVVLSFVLLVVALPVLAAAMVATWLETPGSPLFDQVRVGRDGQPFRLFKLRTMVSNNSGSCGATASTNCRSSGMS
jgi:lipopolysaccharide/colanic/teichoic acid biosynthesis glycosyltransferase